MAVDELLDDGDHQTHVRLDEPIAVPIGGPEERFDAADGPTVGGPILFDSGLGGAGFRVLDLVRGFEFQAEFVGFEPQKVHASERLDLFLWSQEFGFA